MLKTTGIIKKFEEMKNGGYTLFSDKTRKMLFAMGMSLLSIGMLGQTTYAEVKADVTFKKTQKVGNNTLDTLGEDKVRYQITLEEDETKFELEGVYLTNGEKLTPYVGLVEGRRKTLIVVEVPKDTTSINIKSRNKKHNDEIRSYTINFGDYEIEEDNIGPEIEEGSLVEYDTFEEGYLQAKFTDATKIYRVEDEDGHNRVIVKEKDLDKEINLKYILEKEDMEFTIYDILGNPTTVSLEQPVVINYHTRNIDGTQLALGADEKMVIGEGEDAKEYKLVAIKTGAGESIPWVSDDGTNVFTGVPSGTTKMILVYEEVDPEDPANPKIKKITVPLVLDKDAPVVIAYKAQGSDADGYEVEESNDETAKARAYVNGKKAIIEVRDIESGVAKIELLKGTKGNYEPDEFKDANGKKTSFVYDEKKLETTVLKVFDVTENTTAVRVYDGIGNTVDIELGIYDEKDAITIARLEVGDDGKYKLVAQDIRVGLGSILREEEELMEEGDDSKIWPLSKIEISSLEASGDPVIEIYDALGNKKIVSFDEFLYSCIYATYSEHNECLNSGSVSIDVKDERGIVRIEIIMVDKGAGEEPELKDMPTSTRLEEQPKEGDENFEENMKIWNEWANYINAKDANEEWNANYRHTYTLERFRGNYPKEVKKTYAIPDGTVEQVMIYTKYEKNESGEIEEYHNTIIDELIDSTNVKHSDRIKTTTELLKKDSSNRIIGATVLSKYGIKQVTYDDGNIVRFYNDLPTELHVNCLIAAEEDGQVNYNGAVVLDAIGDTLRIQEEKVTFSYNDTEVM